MANSNHLDVLRQGVETWNEWRAQNSDIENPDLSGADLIMANLSGANLSGANLSRAGLIETNLRSTDLSGADLSEAILRGASLFHANLSEADLFEADLSYCLLNHTNFEGSTLTNCNVYGIAAWDLIISEETEQSDLIISSDAADYRVTVDDLEVAQFIYLLFDNRKLRNVIETMTSKAVLILGNFAPERKEVLDAIRERLRERGYLPILFDFKGPQNRNLVDTVATVARLSRYVIVDITQPRSVPAELEAIVPALPFVPVQPLIDGSEEPYAMFQDLLIRDSVLKLHRYKDLQDLLASFDEAVIATAERKLKDLKILRLRALEKQ